MKKEFFSFAVVAQYRHRRTALLLIRRGNQLMKPGTIYAINSMVRLLPGFCALVLDSPHSGTRYPAGCT